MPVLLCQITDSRKVTDSLKEVCWNVCSGSSGVWLGWRWLVLGPGSLRGGIILPPSKGSAVQASPSPESQLESVEGRQHQFLQGWEDWKEGMFSFGSSVAYHQCSRSCTAPVCVRMDTGRSLEVELELWRGWNVHMYLRGVMAWLSSRVNKCSLPREQHVAGGNVRFVRSVKLCNCSHPACWAGSGLHGEAVTQQSMAGWPAFKLLKILRYCWNERWLWGAECGFVSRCQSSLPFFLFLLLQEQQ